MTDPLVPSPTVYSAHGTGSVFPLLCRPSSISLQFGGIHRVIAIGHRWSLRRWLRKYFPLHTSASRGRTADHRSYDSDPRPLAPNSDEYRRGDDLTGQLAMRATLRSILGRMRLKPTHLVTHLRPAHRAPADQRFFVRGASPCALAFPTVDPLSRTSAGVANQWRRRESYPRKVPGVTSNYAASGAADDSCSPPGTGR